MVHQLWFRPIAIRWQIVVHPLLRLPLLGGSVAMWTHHAKVTNEVVRLHVLDPALCDVVRLALLDSRPLRPTKCAVTWAKVVWVADGGFFPWASGKATARTAVQWFSPILAGKACHSIGDPPLAPQTTQRGDT